MHFNWIEILATIIAISFAVTVTLAVITFYAVQHRVGRRAEVPANRYDSRER